MRKTRQKKVNLIACHVDNEANRTSVRSTRNLATAVTASFSTVNNSCSSAGLAAATGHTRQWYRRPSAFQEKNARLEIRNRTHLACSPLMRQANGRQPINRQRHRVEERKKKVGRRSFVDIRHKNLENIKGRYSIAFHIYQSHIDLPVCNRSKKRLHSQVEK